MMKNVGWSYCTVPVFLVGFLMELEFFDLFPKNNQIWISRKSVPVVTELFDADERTRQTRRH